MLACLICLTSLEFSDDSAVCIPSCGHVFHQKCISTCCQHAMVGMNRIPTCPKCRQMFTPNQLIKLYLSSINLDSTDDNDDDESAEIDNVLKESETCLVKINQMMRQMEGMNREMTQVVGHVQSLAHTRKIKKALRQHQQEQQSIQQGPSTPPPQPTNPEASSSDYYQSRFNLRDLKIVISPITFYDDGTAMLHE